MQWTVETFDRTVDAELDALPASLRARMFRLMEMIQNVGLQNVREPHVKHFEGKLWELRARAADGIARGFYLTATPRRVIVLHVFVKRSQKTPRRAIETARERLKKAMDAISDA